MFGGKIMINFWCHVVDILFFYSENSNVNNHAPQLQKPQTKTKEP